MAITRGLASFDDVQRINFFRDYQSNDEQGTRPDITDIEEMIDSAIDAINQILLTAGYTLPIVQTSSPYGYRFVLYWNALGAAEMAERRHGSKGTADEHKEEWEAIRDSILGQTILLTDIPGAPTQEDLAKSGTNQLTSSGAERTPFFLRVQKF